VADTGAEPVAVMVVRLRTTSAARAQPGGVDGWLPPPGRVALGEGDALTVAGLIVAVGVALGDIVTVDVAEGEAVAWAAEWPAVWSAEAALDSRTGSPAPAVARATTVTLKRLSAVDVGCFMRGLLLLLPAN